MSIFLEIDFPLESCHRHILHLDVSDFLQPYRDRLGTVRKMINRIKSVIASVKLRHLNPQRDSYDIVTKWSSTYAIRKIFIENFPFLKDVGIVSV